MTRVLALVPLAALLCSVARPADSPAARASMARQNSPGIWSSAAEIAALTTRGPAWDNLMRHGGAKCGMPHLADQNDDADVCVLAKALIYVRTGAPSLLAEVIAALDAVTREPRYHGRALALGRNLPGYVIAADLIKLSDVAPPLHDQFRGKVAVLLTTRTVGGPSSVVECADRRANNWGTHCGAARTAAAAYLDDPVQLAHAARVFKGWLGDRQSYAGFVYGDRSWQCHPDRPVGINPAGCLRDGRSIDGVLPDDQRRAGAFRWPPPRENYVYDALQGALVTATILRRAGYDAFEWENRALLRAFTWLHVEARYPADGDDGWQPYVINHFYLSRFPTPTPARPGKNMGWTDWLFESDRQGRLPSIVRMLELA